VKDTFLRLRRTTSLGAEAALEVIAPDLELVADAYGRYGLERLTEGLEIHMTEDKALFQGRTYAACRTDGRLLLLSPDLACLPRPMLQGILGHELGHAADYLYPGQWAQERSGRARMLDVSKKGVPTGEKPLPKRWLDDWHARDDDAIERMADAICECVMGVKIGYTGPCLLQTIGQGIRPRPPGLR
jgi:hypothetical protein